MLMFFDETSSISLGVLDYVLIGVVLIGIIIGAKKGFTNQIFWLLGSFGALVGAILLCKTVGGWLGTDGFIFNKVSSFLEGRFTGESATIYTTPMDWTNADNVATALSAMNLAILATFLTNVFSSFGTNAALCDVLPLKVTQIANIAIGFLLTLIVLSIVIAILKKAFTSAAKVPVLSTVDKALGAVTGGAFACVILVGVCFLLVTLGGFVPMLGSLVTDKIYPTFIGGYIQKLVEFISGFVSKGLV